MNFPEFLTYCELKDIIVLHVRLGNEWHAKVANKQKLVIENDNFLATITYIHVAGKYDVLSTSLVRVHTHQDEFLSNDSLETIISTFA